MAVVVHLNGTPHRMWQFMKGSCLVPITPCSRMPGQTATLADMCFLRMWPHTRFSISTCSEVAWTSKMFQQRSDTCGVGRYKNYRIKNAFSPLKNQISMGSAVHCSRLCTPRTDRASYRGGQPVMVPCSITDEPLICRFSREFTMWKSCSWHADRSMGDQRTQINNRTANRGYLPKPYMRKRPVCDPLDRNVTIALQKMN